MANKQKEDPQTANDEAQPRRHRRIRQEQERQQRLIVIGVSVALGLVAVLLLAGIVNEFFIKPQRSIAKVEDQSIPVAEFQRRLRFEQDNLINQINQYLQFGQQFAAEGGANPFLSYVQQLFDDLSTPERFSITVLDTMVEDDLVRALAASYGVSVSDAELQQEVESTFGFDRDAEAVAAESTDVLTDTVTVPMTEEEFQEQYNEAIAGLQERSSLTEAEFRDWVAVRLLRERLQEVAPVEVESTEEMVSARHILIQPEPEQVPLEMAEAEALATIQEARNRIESGEAFEDVAAEVSEDPGSAANGGDLGWFGRGRMVPEFEEAAFSLEPGQLSDLVKSDFGYHLLQVDEVNAETDEVKARHILVGIDTSPSEEAAAAAESVAMRDIAAARDRILAGESFEAVAAELSDDTTTAEDGGDLGWIMRGLRGDAFDAVAFALEPGEVSDAIKTPAGYELIVIDAYDEEHEVEESEAESRRAAAFDEWFNAQLEAAAVERNWSLAYIPDLPSDLLETVQQLRVALLAGQQPQQPEQ